MAGQTARATGARTDLSPRQGTRFGAAPEPGGVRFRVFAPAADLRLHVLNGAAAGVHEPAEVEGGVAEFVVPGAAAGDRYGYSIGGGDLRPDPASRHQPDGVHGASEVIDGSTYRWRCTSWQPPDPRSLVIYELHVGTFSAAGTFAGVCERLGDLVELGVTAIELMPIAEFAGTRNWGYDGVGLYAPSRNYGRPDDLRALVDAAHDAGLAVILDVVYNHLGPEGAYLPQFYPQYMTDRHSTPWGSAINFDGPGSELVRAFVIDNATYWIREYRIDGLRLDATHALIDDSPVHVVAELAATTRRTSGRPIVVHAEDHRNLAQLIDQDNPGAWGLDGVWADDFHHVLRARLAGDCHGYFCDFAGTADELARTIRQGWLFTGQQSRHAGVSRGTDVSAIPMRKFVVCLQNHDQVGNRATGDRLHHIIDPAAWRAASAVLLLSPMTPLLFMGQEWAASTPFQYFTDLEPDLGRLVTEGRRQEFRAFPEFADPAQRERIPDPQARSTFEASRLQWHERAEERHAAVLTLYRDLLRLRRANPALQASDAVAGDADPCGDNGLIVRRRDRDRELVLVALLHGAESIDCRVSGAARTLLTTEDARYAADPQPPAIRLGDGRVDIRFARPGAILFEIS